MKKIKQLLWMCMIVISIAIIIIFIEKDMIASNSNIVQLTFTNNDFSSENINIHAQAQCLDGYEIIAMQVDEGTKIEGITELDFTATENKDYIVKVYYQSLSEQIELTETFTTTVDSIGQQNNNISLLSDEPETIITVDNYQFDKNTGTIIDYIGTGETEITIPKKISEVDVLCIGNQAFSSHATLERITIPDTVTSIGQDSFYECKLLKTVILPNSVTRIENGAFLNCYSLTTIKLPESLTFIGKQAFTSCRSLTKINIPCSMTMIEEETFGDCRSLETIVIPDSITSIGNRTFYNCQSLKTITLPDSITYIGEWAFANCSSLTEIDIPDSVTIIEWDVFQGCSALTKISLPRSITEIRIQAFRDCESLVSIDIPNTVKDIGAYAFYGCKSLTTLTIPHLVTNIGNATFNGCSSLEMIYIPSSIETIADNAFNDSGIRKVVVMNNDSDNIDLQDDSALWNIEKSTGISLPLEWIRIVSDVTIESNQESIQLYEFMSQKVNLEGIFESHKTEKIYQGAKGNDSYLDSIDMPQNYFPCSVEYKIVGKPTSSDTKIIDNQLIVGKDEKLTDLKIQAKCNNVTDELSLKVIPISSLLIKNEPQNTYIEEDIYNPKGLVLTITYADGYQKDISYTDENKNDFTFKYKELDLTTINQSITYYGHTVEQKLKVNNKYQYKLLSDNESIVKVMGQFTNDSYIIIEKMKESNTDLYKDLDNNIIIGNYEVKVVGEYKGKLFITFDVGNEYNTQKAYIRHLKQNGSIETYEEIVVDGKVGITVDELSPFVIYIDNNIHNDSSTNNSNSLTPNENNIQDKIVGNIPKDKKLDEENMFTQNKITQTQDNTNMIVYILLGGLSLVFIGTVMIKKSKK